MKNMDKKLYEQIKKELGGEEPTYTPDQLNIITMNIPSLPESFIERYEDLVDWGNVLMYQTVSERLIEKNKQKFNPFVWSRVIAYQSVSEEFIERHIPCFEDDLQCWTFISKYRKLSERFMETYQDKLEAYLVSEYQEMSFKFIQRNGDWLFLDELVCSRPLPDEFIRKHIDRIDPRYLSASKYVSEDILNDYHLILDWKEIARCERFYSFSFIWEHLENLDVTQLQIDNNPFLSKSEKRQLQEYRSVQHLLAHRKENK